MRNSRISLFLFVFNMFILHLTASILFFFLLLLLLLHILVSISLVLSFLHSAPLLPNCFSVNNQHSTLPSP
ncbi:unnamed protein product [Schistocephalus solidus]|uniref:Ovule protein n=1 Tax=Schistocephalus solidus TaxID=70667 RepID=A0A183TLL8_SCHSO|nr:unnamed protein product [Schistocephalus solidus]